MQTSSYKYFIDPIESISHIDFPNYTCNCCDPKTYYYNDLNSIQVQTIYTNDQYGNICCETEQFSHDM